MAAVLIAETDPRILDTLPRILRDHLPDVDVEICTSADRLCSMDAMSSYDTVAMSPILLQAYRFLKYKRPHRNVAPLLITAGKQERTSAYRMLQRDAFDLIVKPIDPQQAAQTVRLALWQNRLLRLLASKERTLSKFQEHMELYPHDLRAEAQFTERCEIIDSTLRIIKGSMRLMVSIEEESSFFDMAASVEEFTRQRALQRLVTLSEDTSAL